MPQRLTQELVAAFKDLKTTDAIDIDYLVAQLELLGYDYKRNKESSTRGPIALFERESNGFLFRFTVSFANSGGDSFLEGELTIVGRAYEQAQDIWDEPKYLLQATHFHNRVALDKIRDFEFRLIRAYSCYFDRTAP